MSTTMTVPGNLNVQGVITAQGMTVPSNAIGDAQVTAASPITGAKLQCRKYAEHRQLGGTDVVAASAVAFIATAIGTLQNVNVFNLTAATSTKVVTVDVQKSTGGGAFASVLSSVVTVNSSTAARTITAGTITSPGFIAGDVFMIVVAVSGSGTQVQGLLVGMNLDENPA